VAFIKAQKKGVYEERLDPAQLTLELLRFMYRLLFLFFIESRPKELGYAPMGNDVYRLGYTRKTALPLQTASCQRLSGSAAGGSSVGPSGLVGGWCKAGQKIARWSSGINDAAVSGIGVLFDCE